jgi:hypothetical protein
MSFGNNRIFVSFRKRWCVMEKVSALPARAETAGLPTRPVEVYSSKISS